MIRQFRDDDAGRCSRLILACLEHDPPPSSAAQERLASASSEQAILERSRLFYHAVFEAAGGVAGIGGIELNEIRTLFVAPDRRREGIGTSLLRHLEGMVPPVLFPEIFVYATPAAAPFYRARGYLPHGEHVFDLGGVPLRTVFMKKPTADR